MHSRARYVRWQREKTYALLSSSQQVESSKIFSKTIDLIISASIKKLMVKTQMNFQHLPLRLSP